MSTDAEIIARSVRSPAVFSEIFERHAAAIGAYARRRVGHDAAEDVLSDTFLVGFRRRAAFDSRWDSARPWLLGIATRVIRKHRATETAQWRAFERAAGASGNLPRSDTADADGRLDASAAVHRLEPRIASLPSRDRDTLLLYAWGDLTYEEVAVAMGVPVGTVRSRLNRVRRKLAPAAPPSTPRPSTIAKEERNVANGPRA
ncbi:sigma-70 family RNA polymerase sigma factor [Microbacterium sp. MEC084]|nr:sigma-70 family RNA polymerase sigma factor [Microbacterium sp. MEC084]